MNSKKQELITLLSEYRLELAQAEYTAEKKDPLRMEIMEALGKAEKLLREEDFIRKLKEAEER